MTDTSLSPGGGQSKKSSEEMGMGGSRHSSSSSSDDEEEIAMLKRMSMLDKKSFIDPVRGTGFIYDEKMAEHKCDWDSNYPENPRRITEPYKRCTELGLVQRCERLKIWYATEDEIQLKHTYDHIQLAQSTVSMNTEEHKALSEQFDAWYANKHTYEASLIAAGSAISMVEHIIHDKINTGFAMVRPPGHHAMEAEFNGYCTFNNVAIAAQYALDRGIDKILIVDWDVHHGQGVQRAFYEDPRVLYFSIHRYEYGSFWPNLRESDYDHIGKGIAEGFNVNIPLNKTGMTDSDYMAVLNMVLLPLAYEFNPQLVLVCNGLDSAIGDEKGEMLVTPAMYAHMTHQLMALSTGRVCVVLEGGYCIKSLAEGCALTLRSLLLDPCPQLPKMEEPSDSIMNTILNVIKILRPHWTCFKHYETLERSQLCPFEEVNSMPPVATVTFSTPENRPKKFPIIDCYPVQTETTLLYYSDLIDKLIAETSLAVAEYKCCHVFDAEMRSHRNLKDKSHPERPDRISKIYTTMLEWKLLHSSLTVASRLARKMELQWIHGDQYINEMIESQNLPDDELHKYPSEHKYNSIYMHQKSLHCALLSCGSLLNVTEAVLQGKAQSGVAVIRPPGHHAESNKAMGFCFFNNVAVAARFAQKHFNVRRILILDWDVHHGNATQHQFYQDPSVLYISLHRYDHGRFFPGGQDGSMENVGEGPGLGFNVNIPWSGGRMGDAEYIAAFTQIVMPIAYQFAPELVIVSAGFDAAVGDPLGGFNVTPACYGHMTHMLMGLANGKVILSLEGGYNLISLSHSMATCMSVLIGNPCPMLKSSEISERGASIIHDVLEIQKAYWSCLKGSVRIPSVRRVDNQRWAIEKEQHASGLQSDKPRLIKSAKARLVTSSSESTKSSAVTGSTSDTFLTQSSATPSTERDVSGSHSTTAVTTFSTASVPISSDTITTEESSSSKVSDHNVSNVGGDADTSGKEPERAPLPAVSEERAGVAVTAGSCQPLDSVVSEAEYPGGSAPSSAAPITASQGEGATVEGRPGDIKDDEPADVGEITSGVQDLAIGDSRLTGTGDSGDENRRLAGHADGVKASSSETSAQTVGGGEPKQSGQTRPCSAPASSSSSASNLNQTTSPAVAVPQDSAQPVPPAPDRQSTPTAPGDSTTADVKPVITEPQEKPIFKSLIYGDEPDPEPISIFASNPLMASQEALLIAKSRNQNADSSTEGQSKDQTTASSTAQPSQIPTQTGEPSGLPSLPRVPPEITVDEAAGHGVVPEASGGVEEGKSGAAVVKEGAEAGDELLGAVGGSSRPNTVEDFLRMQGAQQMYAVQPLSWCPHLPEVTPLPPRGLHSHDPCSTCGDVSENWVCLTCYKVECSRFVNEHMLMHRLETDHNMVLSYSDLSVWCYACDHYVDNEILFPMKNAAHESKFGESLPGMP